MIKANDHLILLFIEKFDMRTGRNNRNLKELLCSLLGADPRIYPGGRCFELQKECLYPYSARARRSSSWLTYLQALCKKVCLFPGPIIHSEKRPRFAGPFVLAMGLCVIFRSFGCSCCSSGCSCFGCCRSFHIYSSFLWLPQFARIPRQI